jgi:glucose-6-phosphate 1-epimerase
MITMKKFENGFEYLEIRNQFALAKVALQGAHLFHYERIGSDALLWVSKRAYFEEGKAIRGGIPVCWPWFGPNEEDSSLPQHGFARVSKWKVTEQQELKSGGTMVVLELERAWEYLYTLSLKIIVAESLQLSLTTTNLDTGAFEITSALHSYYTVSDISDMLLSGLDGCSYFDQLDSASSIQEGDVRIDAEVDRIYDTPIGTLTIEDKQREVRIVTEGSNSTVVWNPWIDKAASMKDMHEEAYREFVCVETANTRHDRRIVKPGMSHTLTMEVFY